jgi:hypothetical protein
MRCPNCGRPAGWLRFRCPACKSKMPQWYVAAIIVLVVVCYGAFELAERYL